MSRAKTALRTATQTGDPEQIATARDRLTTARAAHQDAKNTATSRDTAAQHGDVTDHDQPTTKDTGMDHPDDQPHGNDHQDHQNRQRRTGFTVHNTNIVTGNATVGSQHDVHHGDHTADPQANTDRAAARLARAQARTQRARDRAQRHTDRTGATTITASGVDIVAQQIGRQFGTTHIHHTEKPAPRTGDVTPHPPRTAA